MFTSVRLQNFRNYVDSSYELAGGVNVVVGPNASGKTGLLEALLVACVGGSYRVGDQVLPKFGSDWSKIETRLSDNSIRSVIFRKDHKLDLRKIPAKPDLFPERPRSFSSKTVSTDTLFSEKTSSPSPETNSDLDEVMRKSSKSQKPATGLLPSSSKYQKTFELNDQVYRRLGYEHKLPVCLFQPEDLNLFSGSPSRRRRFMDDLLSQLSQEYKTSLAGYERALLQRNSLLKSENPTDTELFVWNLRLAQFAEPISRHRAALIDSIFADASEIYNTISSKPAKIGLSLVTDVDQVNYGTKYLRALEKTQAHDRMRGHTSIGPHKDDLRVELDGSLAENVASRGEGRSIVLTLKLLEIRSLEARLGKKPIVLLDDVFSELDGVRRGLLASRLADYQTIITSTDADSIINSFASAKSVHLIAL